MLTNIDVKAVGHLAAHVHYENEITKENYILKFCMKTVLYSYKKKHLPICQIYVKETTTQIACRCWIAGGLPSITPSVHRRYQPCLVEVWGRNPWLSRYQPEVRRNFVQRFNVVSTATRTPIIQSNIGKPISRPNGGPTATYERLDQ